MSSTVSIKQDVHTYQQMRALNPVKYGELLCELDDQGLSQGKIAEQHGIHRQVVGRFQRVGRWDAELKQFVEEHKDCISNTALISQENAGKSTEELLELFKQVVAKKKSKVKKTRTEMSEVKPLQIVPVPSQELEKVPDLESCKAEQKEEHQIQRIQAKEPSWVTVCSQIVEPVMFVLLVCTIGLTTYLVHQGVLFFRLHDTNSVSVWSSAVVSEAIPIVCAGCLALTVRLFHRLVAFLLLVGTISGLGFFMHTSISDGMQRQSGSFTRTENERQIQESAVKALVTSLNALPETYATKRQILADKLSAEQNKLAVINSTLTKFEQERSGVDRIALIYGVWLRIAAMLLNAFLVHLFFGRFRLRKED